MTTSTGIPLAGFIFISILASANSVSSIPIEGDATKEFVRLFFEKAVRDSHELVLIPGLLSQVSREDKKLCLASEGEPRFEFMCIRDGTTGNLRLTIWDGGKR